MEINIKPEEIDKYVKDAIINSTVGRIISEKVEKNMKDIVERKWDNPIDDLIKHIIRDTVREFLHKSENIIIIEKAVQEKFTAQFVGDAIQKVVDRL